MLKFFTHSPLRQTQHELRRSVELAFTLARAHGKNVVLTPTQSRERGQLSLRLPKTVRWGKPTHIPLPKEMSGTGWNEAKPRSITVTPQRKATANVWFLNDGCGALCMKLSLLGEVEMLRYRSLIKRWVRI